jgi:TatD-related deoxyribonuclease
MIILDDHMHLDPRGDREGAIRRFVRAGGTHLILVNKPYDDVEMGNFEREYEVTLSLAERARGAGAKVFVALGPHPVELAIMAEKVGLPSALEKMRRGFDLAFQHVVAGRAVCIGEVGRPHFNVPKDVWDAANMLLFEAFVKAKDAGCAVVLHTEHAGPEVFEELAMMAKKSGIELDRIVKHYSPPSVLREENFGLMPSIISSRPNIKRALEKGDRFMMETDYIDDPARRDAVLPPDSVPLRTKAFLKGGIMSERAAHKVHIENPKRTYGIELEWP